ncbi:hypothetical protein ACGGZK_01915 [Agromyces sp. MMS24-K17]|uniref:hypothetical protein n=1 Tax=Agromyces sp. MMS24-K17 TaxID=3372850 RepID=UPI003754F2B2
MHDSRRAFLALTAAGGLGLVAAQPASPAAAAPVAATGPRVAAPAADLGLVGDGTTDDGPRIQAAYDAGVGAIDFEGGKTYLVNTPVFLDDTSPYAMFVLNLNGATLKLGGGLPTTDAFWRDKTVRWAFFPNTKRGGWNRSANKVAVDTSHRATGGGVGALLSLGVHHGTIDGDGANVGFAISNRTGARFDSVVLYRARVLLSWADYCDVNVLIQCHNRAGGPDKSVLVEQIASGDGLLMQSCKADAAVGLARLKYSRGAEITGTVTGRIELDSCSAVRISSAHQESPIANATMLAIRNSTVTVDSSVFYLTRSEDGNVPPAITIDDSSTDAHSELVLRDCLEMRAHDNGDLGMGALVSLVKPAEDTTVIARGMSSVTTTPGSGGVWVGSAGPTVTGSDEVAAAVAASTAVLATGDWILGRRNGAWAVEPSRAAAPPDPARPVILSTTGGSGDIENGTLPRANPVTYVVVARTADGRSSQRSAISPSVAARDRTVKIVVRVDAAPCELRIWRFIGATTTPDAFASIAVGRPKVTLYDTGTYLAGVRWQAGDAGG